MGLGSKFQDSYHYRAASSLARTGRQRMPTISVACDGFRWFQSHIIGAQWLPACANRGEHRAEETRLSGVIRTDEHREIVEFDLDI